jgi:hypothetical protein
MNNNTSAVPFAANPWGITSSYETMPRGNIVSLFTGYLTEIAADTIIIVNNNAIFFQQYRASSTRGYAVNPIYNRRLMQEWSLLSGCFMQIFKSKTKWFIYRGYSP